MYDAFERYALYWVPTPDQSISRFGLDWTGWCAETGEHHARRPIAGLGPAAGLEAGDIGRHGLHGVLAAPFALARGRNVWALEQAVDHVASTSAPIRVPAVRAAVVAGRIALVPRQPVETLDGLIGRVRAALWGLAAVAETGAEAADAAADGAPLGAPGMATEPAGRPAGEDAALAAESDRPSDHFHIPLTGPIAPGAAGAALTAVEALLARLSLTPLRIGDLALMGDPGSGRPLRVLRRYSLSAADPEPALRGVLETRGPQLLAGLIERTRCPPGFCFG